MQSTKTTTDFPDFHGSPTQDDKGIQVKSHGPQRLSFWPSKFKIKSSGKSFFIIPLEIIMNKTAKVAYSYSEIFHLIAFLDSLGSMAN